MGDRIHGQRPGMNHRLGFSSSFTQQNSSCVPSVKKVSVSRRHRSLQITPQHLSIKEIAPKNIVHVSIRPLTNTVDQHRTESIKLMNRQNSIDRTKTGVQSVKVTKYDQKQGSALQQVSDNLTKDNSSSKTDNEQSEYQRNNHRKPVYAKKSISETENTAQPTRKYFNEPTRFDHGNNFVEEQNTPYSHRRNPTNEHNTKLKKKRRCLAGQCCSCTPLCTFLSLLAALLISSSIAALIIALIKHSSTASTVTTSTTSTATTTSTSSTSTATTSLSTTTTSSISTTTTTARPIVAITRAGDSIMGLYNTSAGQSTGASNGRYSGPSEEPDKAIDGLLTAKYLNFGFQGYTGAVLNSPGVGTGFYVAPNISNASLAIGLLFATANDYPSRDPITVTLEGTNATTTVDLNLGSSWTLIYSGPTGIDPLVAPARSTYVPQQNFSNTIIYGSYRLLVTTQRSLNDAVQYAGAQIIGYA